MHPEMIVSLLLTVCGKEKASSRCSATNALSHMHNYYIKPYAMMTKSFNASFRIPLSKYTAEWGNSCLGENATAILGIPPCRHVSDAMDMKRRQMFGLGGFRPLHVHCVRCSHRRLQAPLGAPCPCLIPCFAAFRAGKRSLPFALWKAIGISQENPDGDVT